jgi:hypothetical protein
MRIEVWRFLIEAHDDSPPAGTCDTFGQCDLIGLSTLDGLYGWDVTN